MTNLYHVFKCVCWSDVGCQEQKLACVFQQNHRSVETSFLWVRFSILQQCCAPVWFTKAQKSLDQRKMMMWLHKHNWKMFPVFVKEIVLSPQTRLQISPTSR